MDKMQQLLQTVSLGNQAERRIVTKYRTGSQNVKIENFESWTGGKPLLQGMKSE